MSKYEAAPGFGAVDAAKKMMTLPLHLAADTLIPRVRAAGIHLAVSVSVALVLVLLITRVWYPSDFFELAKGRDIFILMISCDITLGPALTLVIFNIRKPRSELVRDIAIIAAVQLSAMVYGVSTLLQARPAYIVYNVGQFNVPLANELVSDANTGDEHSLDVPSAPWTGPKLVGARLPKDLEENNKLTFSAVSGRGDVFQMPRYFVPYGEVKAEVLEHTRGVDQLAKELRLDLPSLRSATARYSERGVDFGVLPLRIRTTLALAVVDRKTGDLLGIEPIPSSF